MNFNFQLSLLARKRRFWALLLLLLLAQLSQRNVYAIQWQKNLSFAKQQAKKEDRLLFVHFYTPWCGYCQKMQQITFNDKQVQAELAEYVAVMVDISQDLKAQAEYEIAGVPDNRVYSANGQAMLMGIPGYMPASKFKQEIIKTSQFWQRTKTLVKRYDQAQGKQKQKLALEVADFYYSIQDYTQAVTFYNIASQGMAAKELDARTNRQYGFSLLASGKYQKAVLQFEQYIEKNNKSRGQEYWEIYFLLAYAQMESNESQKAMKSFALVIQNSSSLDLQDDARQYYRQLRKKTEN